MGNWGCLTRAASPRPFRHLGSTDRGCTAWLENSLIDDGFGLEGELKLKRNADFMASWHTLPPNQAQTGFHSGFCALCPICSVPILCDLMVVDAWLLKSRHPRCGNFIHQCSVSLSGVAASSIARGTRTLPLMSPINTWPTLLTQTARLD